MEKKLGHSLDLVSAAAAQGLHICSRLLISQKPVLLHDVVWLLCQPQVKF